MYLLYYIITAPSLHVIEKFYQNLLQTYIINIKIQQLKERGDKEMVKVRAEGQMKTVWRKRERYIQRERG